MKVVLHKKPGIAPRSDLTWLKQKLDQLGVALPEKNVSRLPTAYRLPPDVTRVNDAELSRLMAHCVEYRAYLLPQIALMEVDITALDRQIERKGASIKLAEEEGTKWRGEAVVTLDKDIQYLEDARDKIQAVTDVAKSVAEGLTEKYNLLSRELTRRGMDMGAKR